MNAIDQQAASWVVRRASGALSAEAQHALQQWLEADPRHRGAYVRAQAQWLDLDRLAALHGPLRVQPAVEPLAAISRRQWLAAAAALAAVGAGFSWLLLARGRQDFVSGIGEMRRIQLDDGSTVLLNTASELRVHFDEQQRRVALTHGEALFQVAHDPLRPFVVMTHALAVRAVGTQFDVRLEADRMDVMVTEGTVELARPSGTALPAAVRCITMNEHALIGARQAVEVRAMAAADAERRLAWREGLVSFNQETLQAAVAEINRYNRRQIVIDDPALGMKPVVGVFRTTDLDEFVLAAAQALEAVVVVDGDRLRLRRAWKETRIENQHDPPAPQA